MLWSLRASDYVEYFIADAIGHNGQLGGRALGNS